MVDSRKFATLLRRQSSSDEINRSLRAYQHTRTLYRPLCPVLLPREASTRRGRVIEQVVAVRTIFHEIICLIDRLAPLTAVEDVAIVNVEENRIEDLHSATPS